MPDDVVMIYATFPSAAMAEDIGGALLDLRLVACVNVLAPMTSLYVWNGKRETASEVPAIMKTQRSLSERVVAEICRRHPYETPAVLVLPVAAGARPFLDWVRSETASPA